MRGDKGDIMTKSNVESQMVSWKRKGTFMEKLVKFE